MLHPVFMIIIFIFSIQGFAEDNALKYVPGGEVVQKKYNEVKVKGPKGGIIEIEYSMTGALDEASGNSVDNDIFVPEEGLIPLEEVVKKFNSTGKKASGEWSLEHSMIHGWFYELQEFVNGQQIEYKVDAKNGSIISSKLDD